jgi:hypothetical protein
MALRIQTVAQEYSSSDKALTREGSWAYLLTQRHRLVAEQQACCAKFGVTSLAEMDARLQAGAVSEEGLLEDFQQVAYLTTRVGRIKHVLEEPSCRTSRGCGAVPRPNFFDLVRSTTFPTEAFVKPLIGATVVRRPGGARARC